MDSIMIAIRAANPSMRRTKPVAIGKNTSATREYKCLCGASITCCNRYAPTKRVRLFCEEHNDTAHIAHMVQP